MKWFDGLAITLEDNGDTLLTGPVADQATFRSHPAAHALTSVVFPKPAGAAMWVGQLAAIAVVLAQPIV